ncbi:MAG TPA: O-antigen ligase family protein [Verrucomicrobiae bacterium]|nr:O-antigen ligase family protein [Verrucomicrobiae bacterium]
MHSNPSVEWWRPAAYAKAETRPATRDRSSVTGNPFSFWTLMVFTFFMILAPQTLFPALESLHLPLLTAAIAITAFLWDAVTHRGTLGVATREIGVAAALAAWAVATIPLSYDPGNSLGAFLNYYSKALVIFWLVANVVDSAKKFRQAFLLLTLMAIPLAITGVQNYLSGVYLAGSDMQRIQGYDAPLTGNPNDLALMLNIVLPLSVALLMTTRNLAARIVLPIGILVSAVAIIVTFSRGGFITLVSLLLLYLWRFRRRRGRLWIWGLIPFLLVCIPLIGPTYLERLSTISNMEADKTGSAQERWSDMVAAATFIEKHPLVGAGLGQSALATREERGPDGGLVHNVYLQYAAELGLPGLLLFLILFIQCLKSTASVQRRARQKNDRHLFYIGEAVQLSLIAFAISAMFHPVAYHIHFYYIAGFAVAARKI